MTRALAPPAASCPWTGRGGPTSCASGPGWFGSVHSMRRPLSWLGTLFLALPVAAQTGSVTRSVDVSVTNVDVVVTDSAGKPITDLSSADFEVRQDGKLQPITNFSFIRNAPPPPAPAPAAMPEAAGPPVAPAEPAPPPAARAHLIVFLDELHLTTVNRNRAIRSLRDYLPTIVGPHVGRTPQ